MHSYLRRSAARHKHYKCCCSCFVLLGNSYTNICRYIRASFGGKKDEASKEISVFAIVFWFQCEAVIFALHLNFIAVECLFF